MSNPTIPPSPTAANLPPCPLWCDPKCCLVYEKDVEHRSTPVQVDTIDAEYTLTLARLDELSAPQEWDRAPSILLYVESKAYATTPGGETPQAVSAEITSAAEACSLIAAIAGLLATVGGAS